MDKHLVRRNGCYYGPFDSHELALYWVKMQKWPPGTFSIYPLISV